MAAVNVRKPSNKETFPSWTEYYGKFKNGGGSNELDCSDTNGCDNEIKKYGLGNGNLRRHLADSRKALGYIYREYRKNGEKKSLECTARHFLYYWLGDKISSSTWGIDNFPAAISVICRQIRENSKLGQGCKFPCDNPNEETFNNRKLIFDHYHNYDTVEQYLMKDKIDCKDQWSDYQKGITAACKTVKEDCARTDSHRDPDDEYCKQFKAKYGAYCSMMELLELYCKTDSQLQDSKGENMECSVAKDELKDYLPKATTTTALSSILGTLATIGTPFLLYKYKPWSSWFGNHFSVNGVGRSNRSNRGRRSVGRDIDTLTDGILIEDSSTVDFTGSSDTSSILDSSTIPSTAPYNTRPSNRGRGRTGAGTIRTPPGRPNVGYQNM